MFNALFVLCKKCVQFVVSSWIGLWMNTFFTQHPCDKMINPQKHKKTSAVITQVFHTVISFNYPIQTLGVSTVSTPPITTMFFKKRRKT